MMTEYRVSAAEVFFLGIEALKAAGVKRGTGIKKAQRIILLGKDTLQEQEHTVSFRTAVESMLNAKRERLRPVSLRAMKTMLNRLMRMNPQLGAKSVRAIKTETCKTALTEAFRTPRQFVNGRAILSAVFGHALKRGWTDKNPVCGVDIPVIEEQRITALSPEHCKTLIMLAKEMYGGACAVAAGMMLYAGIRPAEVSRLQWGDVSMEESVISIPARHSKTGGARHMSIYPPLKKLLQSVNVQPQSALIVPKNWRKKWRKVRAKFTVLTGQTWQQDVLRHTFASYHAKRYRNFDALQMEMGHSNAYLLRTRYLNMQGIGKKEARQFWMPTLFFTPHGTKG